MGSSLSLRCANLSADPGLCSYWSLLAPAIELAEESGVYGAFAFAPVAVGFLLGAAFVWAADLLLPWLVRLGVRRAKRLYIPCSGTRQGWEGDVAALAVVNHDNEAGLDTDEEEAAEPPVSGAGTRIRRRPTATTAAPPPAPRGHARSVSSGAEDLSDAETRRRSWRRTLLLALAVTIHNIPEGRRCHALSPPGPLFNWRGRMQDLPSAWALAPRGRRPPPLLRRRAIWPSASAFRTSPRGLRCRFRCIALASRAGGRFCAWCLLQSRATANTPADAATGR